MGKKLHYNENYFDIIDSEDKAYFLGFIFSDGSLRTRKRKQLTIKIHPKDIDILEKFKLFINYEGNIYHSKTRNICQISLSGEKLISSLLRYGLHENKTLSIEYPNIPNEYESDFIRGFFDGDGCIRLKYDKRTGHSNGHLVIVCGSILFLNSLNERMIQIFNIRRNKLYGPKDKSYRFISWTGLSDIENIYRGFYNGSKTFVNRKRKIFDEVYELHQTKKKYRK